MTDKLLVVDLQDALSDDEGDKPPSAKQLSNWANLAYSQVADVATELTLRLVDETEMIELNSNYRGKQGSTNVLSFPFEQDFDFSVINGAEVDLAPALLGDIVICHAVIRQQALEQKKNCREPLCAYGDAWRIASLWL